MHTARMIDAGDTNVYLPAIAALRELWQVELGRVRKLSRGGKGFTAVHYAAAALQLLDSQQDCKAVGLQDMEELLGRYVEGAANEEDASAAGAAVLERMVQANALSVRPRSAWARDVPVEAFGDGESLVTAPSTMDLYCMRRIRSRLEKVLNSAQQANPPQVRRVREGHTVAAARSGSSSPPPSVPACLGLPGHVMHGVASSCALHEACSAGPKPKMTMHGPPGLKNIAM